MEERIRELMKSMAAYEAENPRQIQHSLKVHSFAKLIGESEGLDAHALFTLEAAAIVHDVGIKAANEKFGHCTGKLQEQEGPAPARAMMEELGFEADVIERVCYLVAHHHTYEPVDGMDYRILLEADYLVNLYEDGSSMETIRNVLEQVFRTETGIWLCTTMFGVE